MSCVIRKEQKAVWTPSAAVGFTKNQLAMADATWSFSCTQYHRRERKNTVVLMPRSLKAEHGQEPWPGLNSIPTQSMCFLKLIGSYIFFPSKAFIKPWFQRTRSLVKVPLSIKCHTSALCDSSYIYQHAGMVTFKHFLVVGPFQVTSSGNFGVTNQFRHTK